MTKSLLIIGGTGFFGNSILNYFSKYKFKKKISKITIISRNKLPNHTYIKKLKKNYKIIKINSDVLKLTKLPYADYVICAISSKSPKNDYLAIKRYFNLAKIYHRDSKILFTSSGAVYGVQTKNIKSFNENHPTINKKNQFKKGYKNSYANYKLKSEKLFQKLGFSGIKVSIARCFTFVGEFLPKEAHYVIGNIIQNIFDKKKITINADYKIYRSYMYSDDLVIWLLKILLHSSYDCQIYNVGSDNKITINKITKILKKKYNLIFDISKVNSKIADCYLPSVKKAQRKLGLKIKYSNMKAIFKTINNLKKSNKTSN